MTWTIHYKIASRGVLLKKAKQNKKQKKTKKEKQNEQTKENKTKKENYSKNCRENLCVGKIYVSEFLCNKVEESRRETCITVIHPLLVISKLGLELANTVK